MDIKFLGAAGTVTGSKTLVTVDRRSLLVDCGMFQGLKKLRERNWQPLPINIKTLKSVVLTHAHIDHSGYIPALVKQGFRGRVYCTPPTYALCRVLLPDAGFLQEEDARYANKRKFSRHAPALPLFTEEDAWEALKHFEVVHFDTDFAPMAGVIASFSRSGHILGAGSVRLQSQDCSLLFSGDLGRQQDDLMYPPAAPPAADYMVVESTYGDRLHEATDVKAIVADLVNRTSERGGIVLIPAFAVGRAQSLLYLINELKKEGRIANLPVFLNSPMAITATEVFYRYHNEHKLNPEQCAELDAGVTYVRTVEESIALNNKRFPCIIISASGMASGGRVLHHLKTLLPNHRNSVLFAGYQAAGTRGEALVHGADKVKIHGDYHVVNAEIVSLDSLSAHADYSEILTWLKQVPASPKKVFITHGEPLAADSLRKRIREILGWEASVADYLEALTLGSSTE
jgi:metallo-beta-lactamase family protein